MRCDTVVGMAHTWWVNLSIAVPFVSYFLWRIEPFSIRRCQLLAGALFAASFGVVEGIVVVYLRAVVGAVAGYGASMSEVARFVEGLNRALRDPAVLPVSLLKVEMCREVSTILMLL